MNPFYQELLAERFDTFTASEPAVRILVCTTPRTAGHTFCEAMRQQGWGVPTEYFTASFALSLYRRWISAGCTTTQEVDSNIRKYGEVLLAKRSANGIFSVKLFPSELKPAWDAIGNIAARTCYIYLTRQDKVAQSLSFATLLLTGKPFNDDTVLDGIPRIEKVDEVVMERLYRWILQMEDYWVQRGELVDPSSIVEVNTEEFLSEPMKIMELIAAKFDLPLQRIASMSGTHVDPYEVDSDLKRELTKKYRGFLEGLSA